VKAIVVATFQQLEGHTLAEKLELVSLKIFLSNITETKHDCPIFQLHKTKPYLQLYCSQSCKASEGLAKILVAEVAAIRDSWIYKDFTEVTKWYYTEILAQYIDADGLDWFIKKMVELDQITI
jgi:hypothetical protein